MVLHIYQVRGLDSVGDREVIISRMASQGLCEKVKSEHGPEGRDR